VGNEHFLGVRKNKEEALIKTRTIINLFVLTHFALVS
jgi:hypothetical protein